MMINYFIALNAERRSEIIGVQHTGAESLRHIGVEF